MADNKSILQQSNKDVAQPEKPTGPPPTFEKVPPPPPRPHHSATRPPQD